MLEFKVIVKDNIFSSRIICWLWL